MDIPTFIENLHARKNLSEDEVKNLLRQYGIPTTDFKTITAREDISKISVQYPAVMKICSPRILHKTEVNGVVLNIGDEKELMGAFDSLRKRFPDEKILVENMEKDGLELIMGVINDDSFGLSIMLGLGGVFTEVLEDVSFRVLPITRYDAEKMIDDLKSSKVFEGFRGIAVDKTLVIEILLKLSTLGQDYKGYLSQMDLNPVLVREKDAVVLDAKMILK